MSVSSCVFAYVRASVCNICIDVYIFKGACTHSYPEAYIFMNMHTHTHILYHPLNNAKSISERERMYYLHQRSVRAGGNFTLYFFLVNVMKSAVQM